MAAEELLRKLRELEEGQAELKREISKLVPEHHRRPQSPSSSRRPPPPARRGLAALPQSSSSRLLRVGRVGLTDRQHIRALHALGQAVHVIEPGGKLLYWNRYAEHMYGYSASEAVGQDAVELLVHPDDAAAANTIIGNIFTGKCWRGKFPVKKKSGERFFIVANNTPLYDDDGSLVGLICLSVDTRTLEEIMGPSTSVKPYTNSVKLHLEVSNQPKSGSVNKSSFESRHQQPSHPSVTSKIATLQHRLPRLHVQSALGSGQVRTAMNGMASPVRASTMNIMPRKNWDPVEQAPQVRMYCIIPLLQGSIPLGMQAKQVVMTQVTEKDFTRFLVQRQRHFLPRRGYHGLGEDMNMMVLARVTLSHRRLMIHKRMTT